MRAIFWYRPIFSTFLPKTHYKLPLQLPKKIIVKYFAAFIRIAASDE
jgi:hypothetical protein